MSAAPGMVAGRLDTRWGDEDADDSEPPGRSTLKRQSQAIMASRGPGMGAARVPTYGAVPAMGIENSGVAYPRVSPPGSWGATATGQGAAAPPTKVPQAALGQSSVLASSASNTSLYGGAGGAGAGAAGGKGWALDETMMHQPWSAPRRPHSASLQGRRPSCADG